MTMSMSFVKLHFLIGLGLSAEGNKSYFFEVIFKFLGGRFSVPY